MEFPFGRHHHGRDEDNTGDYPRPPYPPPPFGGDFPHPPPPQSYPPPPSYGGPFESFPHPPPPPQTYPPPSQVTRIHHSSHTPHLESPNYPPPPPQPSYSHEYGSHHTPNMGSPNYPSYGHQSSFESESHESGGGGLGGGSHHFRPHMPSFIEGHFHHSSSDAGSHHDGYDHTSEGGALNLGGYFANKPTFKIYSKAGGDTYCVAIRDRKVVLAHSDPDDLTQHWYKDEKYSTKVKDEDGYPSFALVNKATGQALKHSVSAHPVQLVPYKPDVLDSSILWTESKDLGSGFRTIRMVNNVHLVLDAFNGDKDHGGVHEGTIIALYKPWKGDNQNQQWKLYPHSHA